ncbi:hypothetical protein NW762_003494 [Fusarium torreyae]|uniref:Uncharacterized protein n=1 Tax=Fusarium torreyae TaxID=1237075 RepID=A0A9W8S7U9_9HYPO|nr:hypothetical protein NW762_003494 [Fusarium torreyae]
MAHSRIGRNIIVLLHRKESDTPSRLHCETWTQLLQEQHDVEESATDEAAFRHSPRKFSSFKDVSVAPATHKFL